MGIIASWTKTAGDPTLLGWATTFGYALAVVLCFRAARVRQYAGGGESAAWRVSVAVLLFLGFNKQLDLQTLLIAIGRAAALTEGWYDDRRVIQKLFVVVLTLALAVLVWRAASRHELFFRNHRLLAVGLGLVLIYGLLRAAEIDHIKLGVSSSPADQPWLWIIEMTGVISCILAAMRDCRAFVPPPAGITTDAAR
jgi:hypothetical protein